MSEDDNSGIPLGILFYKNNRIVAPISIHHKLIQNAHGTDHIGITKTYNVVRSLFFWPTLFTAVKSMVSSCQICQLSHNINPHELVYHLL